MPLMESAEDRFHKRRRHENFLFHLDLNEEFNDNNIMFLSLFILVNLFIFLAAYLSCQRLKITSVSEKFICAGLWFAAQIIMTEFLLGFIHLLYLPILLIVNLLISFLLLKYARINFTILSGIFQNDIKIIRVNLKASLGWENYILIFLMVVVSAWMILAAYFLPPRGVDDLTYHLAPIYQAIQTHRMTLLPVALRGFFAFPFNAEYLFMWPAIFFHSQQWVDIVQYIVACWGIVIIYALAKSIQIETRIAFFVAALFLFTPVVLAQSGSNYIDLIVNIFYLCAFYLSWMFYRTNRLTYLYLAGICSGLLIGMKCHMILLLMTLQPFILIPLIRNHPKKHYFDYLGIILLFGGFWYLRNWFYFQNPVYPMDLFQKNMGIFSTPTQTFSLSNFLLDIRDKLWFLGVKDTGVGSFHGGFGMLFWAIGFPSWIYLMIRSQRANFLFWGQLLIGIFMLLLIPMKDFYMTPRYSLFVVAIGLLAMGKFLMEIIKTKKTINSIRVISIIFSTIAIFQLSKTSLPSYRIDKPIKDIAHGSDTTETKYLSLSGYMPYIWKAWEALDYLTLSNKHGVSCYMAVDGSFYWTSPTYGTHLQNRIWNFEPNPAHKPDALIYGFGKNRNAFYFKTKIPMEEIAVDPEYSLIIQGYGIFLFMKNNFFDEKNKKLLADYYRKSFPESINFASKLKKILEKNIPIMTTHSVGYGFKYLELTRRLNNPVYFVPKGMEGTIIQQHNWKIFYTWNVRPQGFTAVTIAKYPDSKWGEMTLYKATKENE